MNEEQFLKLKFKEFYKTRFIQEPPSIQFREFGFGLFGQKISQRHLAFQSSEEFNAFLRDETPFFVSYSGAYYKFPSRTPMQKKDYLKADLFYEFDADDLKTKCSEKHNRWKCKCGEKGQGLIENCFSCGERVLVEEWVCPECLNEVKKQVLRLMNFFENDLNLTQGISLNFSGGKGFHIHVRDESIHSLSSSARIELFDYLTATGLNLFNLGFYKNGKTWVCPKTSQALGWGKRLLNSLKDFFRNCSQEELAVNANITISTAKKILEKKDILLTEIDKGFLFSLPKKTDEFWNSLLNNLIKEIKLDLDRQTSIDLVKILRVPETLHGGTGLIAKNVSLNELKNFNALDQCIAFSSNPLKVFVEDVPEFFIGKKFFGPFTQEEVELPEFAAIYLLAKQKAKLTQNVKTN